MLKKVSVLGSTGSIGRQALDVIAMFPQSFKVETLVAGSNIKLLEQQVYQFNPSIVAVHDINAAQELKRRLKGLKFRVLGGKEGVRECAAKPEVDIVINAISGISGLLPTLEAIKQKKQVALANKETLVSAGEVVMKEVEKSGKILIPVDSEHSAIFQCLQNECGTPNKIILTASGGPFRTYPLSALEQVTPEQALKHPNWHMGKKISVDSATMINKALEVIEAHWLFDLDYSCIEVVIHPESIVHSMVGFKDGAVLAQLGLPDMRVPIQYALTWPERWANDLAFPNWFEIGKLTFEVPDRRKFPGLELAYQAGEAGGTAPAALNAANEVAVDLFLHRKINFLQISELVASALDAHQIKSAPDLEDILEADRLTRQWVWKHSG